VQAVGKHFADERATLNLRVGFIENHDNATAHGLPLNGNFVR
jgi:hypothetical protein